MVDGGGFSGNVERMLLGLCYELKKLLSEGDVVYVGNILGMNRYRLSGEVTYCVGGFEPQI